MIVINSKYRSRGQVPILFLDAIKVVDVDLDVCFSEIEVL